MKNCNRIIGIHQAGNSINKEYIWPTYKIQVITIEPHKHYLHMEKHNAIICS